MKMKSFGEGRIVLACALLGALCGIALGLMPAMEQGAMAAGNPKPPTSPVKLIFIHHSSGENWLVDGDGGLGIALKRNNYFVSDTNYGWGPEDLDSGGGTIGDHTDIGYWYNWFAGPNNATYLDALYSESGKHSDYSRLAKNPDGENEIIMFKSCFPNSNLGGSRQAPPTTGNNPLRGQDAYSEFMTLGNAKGIYNDILQYFATRQDKLFVVITAPPLSASETTPRNAANARALNRWLVKSWLRDYPYKNVGVFDFYNVLTSNGGDPDTNDAGQTTGNHHRWWKRAVQYIEQVNKTTSAYRRDPYDSHPTTAGNLKAKVEFVKVLNVLYNRWQASLTALPAATAR
jgi:hypothetical protein